LRDATVEQSPCFAEGTLIKERRYGCQQLRIAGIEVRRWIKKDAHVLEF
jgi:hypothetical protein